MTMKIPFAICCSLVTFVLACPATLPAAEAAQRSQPNVLFIISDDLTATALSCYGNTLCQTPNIDRVARKG